MDTSALDYHLPPELIAQRPLERRDQSRLMVLDRATGGITLDTFTNIDHYLRAGDIIAYNDTRVIHARLRAHKPTGGQVEIFLLREESPGVWTALLKPSAKAKPGTVLELAEGLTATAEEVLPDGKRRVRFSRPDVLQFLEEVGEVPLPPYIAREGRDEGDRSRYQTVYASRPGAVAAPTAGLHYTEEVLARLEAMGVKRAPLTLHVGYGTFKPISAETLQKHSVDPEDFELTEPAVASLNAARAAGGRVLAVGTTATRVLESQWRDGRYQPGAGQTGLYIYPGYTFRAVDMLQTNFHLPKSSLLALVTAFAGVDFVMEAYQLAVAEKFRFYSYGDVMLII